MYTAPRVQATRHGRGTCMEKNHDSGGVRANEGVRWKPEEQSSLKYPKQFMIPFSFTKIIGDLSKWFETILDLGNVECVFNVLKLYPHSQCENSRIVELTYQ